MISKPIKVKDIKPILNTREDMMEKDYKLKHTKNFIFQTHQTDRDRIVRNKSFNLLI